MQIYANYYVPNFKMNSKSLNMSKPSFKQNYEGFISVSKKEAQRIFAESGNDLEKTAEKMFKPNSKEELAQRVLDLIMVLTW